MKKGLFFIVSLFSALFVASCSNEDNSMEAYQEAQVVAKATRSVSTKTPKLTIYIETNDINPLNMGEYYFTGTDEPVVDHVILFASNIRGTISTVELHHNYNQTYILNNVNTLVKPLQDKGIKVLLGLLGDHTGIGFANLTSGQIDSFAQQVAYCVSTYGLDGVDLGDGYAEYGRIPGTPSPSRTHLSLLIQRLRQFMPDKLITAYRFGYVAFDFDQATLNALDYMWPYFGISNAPSEFSKSKWARMSIHYTQGVPNARQIQTAASSYADYGAIMMFNVRNTDASGTMNNFAPNVWGGRTVSWTGTVYPKDY